jgi:hypothetical protein
MGFRTKIKEKDSARITRALGLGLPLLLLAGYAALAALPDLRPAVPEMLGITALIVCCLSLLVALEERGRTISSPAVILLFAAAFRLLFLLPGPQLSDDLYRYLLDGRQLASGRNPYALSPQAAAREDAGLRPLVAKVNHPRLVTVYPPAAQVLFAVGASLGGATGIKLLFIGLDLLCIGLMMRLLSACNLPVHRVRLYAWHPLPVLEIASSGHVDGAGLLLLFAALCLLGAGETGRKTAEAGRAVFFWSGFLFAAAVLVKLFPIVYFPLCLCLVRKGRRGAFTSGAAVAATLLILAFCPDIAGSLATLKTYAATWEFSGLLFQLLRGLLSSGARARIVLGILFGTWALLCYRYAANTGRIEGKAIGSQARLTPVLTACYRIALAFLLFTPTLHPWYGLYMLALLPFSPGPAGWVLSWSILLGYRVLIPFFLLGKWVEGGGVPALIWGGPALAALCRWGCARRGATILPEKRQAPA